MTRPWLAHPPAVDLPPIPGLRGALQADAPLAPLSWFRTGGPADWLFTPADEDDLAPFLAACPAEIPVLVVGLGSNLLVRDGGVRGVVVRLGRGLSRIAVEGLRVTAGAGAADVKVARAAAEAGHRRARFPARHSGRRSAARCA